MNMIAARHGASDIPKRRDGPQAVKDERVNILIVDDMPDKLLVYRTILEDLNQNLMMASSGEEALKLVLKHEFAVILLDVNMSGMDGFETAALIRKRKKSARTPIIFLTAFVDEMYVTQGYANGAVDYLPTPVVPDILRAKVQVFVELSFMRQQAASQAEERARRTAAEELARRSMFLVRVSEILSDSHNLAEVSDALVRLPVPYLADLSLIWLADNEVATGEKRWASIDKKGEVNSGVLTTSLQDVPWLEQAMNQVYAAGELQFVAKPASFSQSGQIASSQDSLFPLSAISQISSALILPLVSYNQVRGVLILARKNSIDLHQSNDIVLASDFASRGSVALENIILIERIKEADRRKDEFLGMLAHELRNPLGPIRNAVQLMQLIGSKDTRFEQAGDIVGRQVTHMTRLIDDLLDATRLARGKILLRREICDLTQIARQTAEDYKSIFAAKGLQLEIEIPSIPVLVDGDPTRLIQMIGNLLHNAHKFTDTGGKVMIRLESESNNEAIIVSVRDNGIGISPAVLPYIFDIFRQAEQGLDRSRGGLGLGLALVKGLVRLHGGTVGAFSEGFDKGAEFTLRLPIAAAPVANCAPDIVITKPNTKNYRILLIEDNVDAAESARLLLKIEGHEVQMASSGAAGIEAARLFRPDIIVCDIGLPGMDGYQVAHAIRRDKTLSSAYMVAVTGYGRKEDQLRAYEAGFDYHLTKPVDYNNLCRILAELPVLRANDELRNAS